MRRIALVLGVFVVLAAPYALAEEDRCTCTPSCRFGLEEKTITVGITGAIRTPFENVSIRASVSLSYTLSHRVTVTHECGCTPCCPGQVATSAYGIAPHVVEAWDPSQPEKPPRTLNYEIMTHLVPEAFSREGPIVGPRVCQITERFTSSQLGGTLSLGFAAGLGYKTVSGTVTLSSEGVAVECVPICRPEEAKGCDHAPRITDYPTGGVWLPEDGSTSFDVAVFDPDWPGDRVKFEASSAEAQVSYSGLGEPNEEGKRLVTIHLGPPNPGVTSSTVVLSAEDECKNSVLKRVPFFVIRYPVIRHIKTEEIDPGWCGRGYKKKAFWLTYEIEDPNVGEPLDVRVQVSATGGRATIGLTPFATTRVTPRLGDKTVLVRFCPDPCVEKGHVTLEAWFVKYPEVKAKSEGVDIRVPNEAPRVAVNPSKLKTKLGKSVRATVTAVDPDGDRIISLTKVFGPGSFSNVHYRGDQAKGEYEWTTTGYSVWYLVGFKATDCVGGSGLAYLLIHVLQPPRAYSGYARVPRGGTATASLYIEDPDTPPEGSPYPSRPHQD